MSNPTLLDRARALLAAAGDATARPWRWWTSNSFLRLSSDPSGKDGDVLHGTVHPVDKHPDVVCSEANQEFIVGACNNAEELAAFAVEFARALPGLYREHEAQIESDGWFACPKSGECTDSSKDPNVCTCGVDEHSARLDALAAKLGIEPRERSAVGAPCDHTTALEHSLSPKRILCDWCDEPANSVSISGRPWGRAINCRDHGGTSYSDLPSSPEGFYFKGQRVNRAPRRDNNWLRDLPLADDAVAVLRARNVVDQSGDFTEEHHR